VVEAEAERGTVEEQLVEAQRLASVGLLAGGIAHDFNNVLTVVLTSVMMLRDRLKDRPDTREDLQEIEAAARWGAALTRQLLAYARRRPEQSEVVDLNELTLRTGRLLRRLIGEHIELSTTPLPAPARVRADPAQVEQVLVNLALNARDAMPDGGRLAIETTADSGWVGITISDTGHGMTPDVMARLAEPLFTTKPQGRGTGLGLAISYMIVRQNGGHIEVSSEPGEGTVFRLHFPRVDEESPEAPLPQEPGGTPGGSETILLAEDEAVVRAVAAKTLRTLGYTVLEACHGPEALAVAARHEGAIDLLVTDVVMPHMSGRTLADTFARSHPGMPVLFTSGYPAHVLSGWVLQGRALLNKPYDPDRLARLVRQLLDDRRSDRMAPSRVPAQRT
jgi:CheY-like chemotaxis protein